MKRGVKRQTEDQADEPSKEEDSPEKKLRIDANLLRFEQMKKEAEENRRRVRDQYLKEHEQEKLLNVHEGTTSSSSTSRRETIAAVPSSRTQHSTSKSTSKIGNPYNNFYNLCYDYVCIPPLYSMYFLRLFHNCTFFLYSLEFLLVFDSSSH